MKKLNPYIMFSGTCEKALAFYKKCLGGDIVSKQTFADSPVDAPDEYKHKIFNSEFRADDIHFMASDTLPGYDIVVGSNVALFLTFSIDEEQEKAFAQLSEGGKIIFPLENKFGMLVDKYGIQWMLSFSQE